MFFGCLPQRKTTSQGDSCRSARNFRTSGSHDFVCLHQDAIIPDAMIDSLTEAMYNLK